MEEAAAYDALLARDPRFDGVFFVGVSSTGIYCRPICPVKTPKRANCTFFASPEAAEKQGFRPCLRCRPELAPGSAPVDDAQRIAHQLVRCIEEGLLEDNASMDDIAAHFELSARQLRRIVQAQMGVSPIELIQTRRLLLAKQLLTETALPVTDVAFASGFASLRRFNDAFNKQYRMSPTRLRKSARAPETMSNAPDAPMGDARDTSTLQLFYRAPFDWDGILEFLRARTLKGAEWVTDTLYARTVQLGDCTGWICVRNHAERHTLYVQCSHSLTPVLPALLGRLRNLFDLNARPDIIAAHLQRDKRLRKAVQANPGLRVPGAFDGFEMAVRAVLGQQVTVKSATTLAGRYVDALGTPIKTPFPALNRLAPSAARVAKASVDTIASLGIVGARARTIIALGRACASGELPLDVAGHPDAVMAQLQQIAGIGAWTAHYIAMRALRWPDAYPKEDVAVRKRLGGVTAREADALSQPWRPWRSYAVLHIWRMAAPTKD